MTLTPLSVVHRIVAAVFALLLLTMAYLQLNDPDPSSWVAIYAFSGLLAAVAVFGGVYRLAAWLLLAVALAWSAWLFPSVLELFLEHPAGDLFTGMSPDRPYVEEARESLGLLIDVLAMAYLLFASRQSAAQSRAAVAG